MGIILGLWTIDLYSDKGIVFMILELWMTDMQRYRGLILGLGITDMEGGWGLILELGITDMDENSQLI